MQRSFVSVKLKEIFLNYVSCLISDFWTKPSPGGMSLSFHLVCDLTLPYL